MGTQATTEKAEEELLRAIAELHRQHRQITERLSDPRGQRRGPFVGSGPRDVAAAASNGAQLRGGFVRPAEGNDTEDQPPAKRRLLSAVVKVCPFF